MEEFQESEVLWPDHHHHHHHRNNRANKSTYNQMSSPQSQSQSQSQPVSIPNASNLRSSLRWSEFENLEEGDGGEKMVPPHEILGRRWNGKMAFSVCTGNGRTLKGRDLSTVRNSILRMTGFLESC